MPTYDVVVIGAGNGGLTSAACLAQKGLKVLLLERHNVPGGCATSFVRGRFEFEVALHQLSGVGTKENPGPIRNIFNAIGAMDRMEFVQMENLYRIVIPGEMDLVLKADRKAAIAELKEKFPKEADNIDRFFELLYGYWEEFLNVEVFADPEASPSKYPLYYKYTLKPSQEVLDGFFDDPELMAAIGVYWCYIGLPPSKLTFFYMAALLIVYLEYKPWHLKGGSQALSNALIDVFTEAGGAVRFNCAAKEIKVSDGRVTGVVTEDGDQVSCKWVVSNAGSLTTYLSLIDPAHVPDSRMQELNSKSIGTSFVSLYLGFDCEPEELGITNATNFIIRSVDADEIYKSSKTLDGPGLLLLSCYDVDDPEFSPKGTCQASVVSIAYAEPWLSIPPDQYDDVKNAYADEMIEYLSKVFPKLRDHIEEVEVSTPLTHIRYLGHPGGAAYGFDKLAKDSPLFLNQNSPIQGLMHVGAWTGGGGFQPTLMSGESAASKIIKTFEL